MVDKALRFYFDAEAPTDALDHSPSGHERGINDHASHIDALNARLDALAGQVERLIAWNSTSREISRYFKDGTPFPGFEKEPIPLPFFGPPEPAVEPRPCETCWKLDVSCCPDDCTIPEHQHWASAPPLPSDRYVRITPENADKVPEDAPIIHLTPHGWQEYDGDVASVGIFAYLPPQDDSEPRCDSVVCGQPVVKEAQAPPDPPGWPALPPGARRIVAGDVPEREDLYFLSDESRWLTRYGKVCFEPLYPFIPEMVAAGRYARYDAPADPLLTACEGIAETLAEESKAQYHFVTVTSKGAYVAKEDHERECAAIRREVLEQVAREWHKATAGCQEDGVNPDLALQAVLDSFEMALEQLKGARDADPAIPRR